MPRSVSLSAYLTLARTTPGQTRTPARTPVAARPRPHGEVIWAHATTEVRAAALVQIAARLQAQRPDLHLLLTLPPDLPAPEAAPAFLTTLTVPEDTPPVIASFLDHWAPDLCLWTGGQLRHALINAAADRKVPTFLIDADESGFDTSRWRWLPDLTKVTLRRFDKVLASTGNSANRLLKLGVAARDITITGPLMEGCAAIPCDDKIRDRMAQLLDSRPVWLAAMVQPAEVPVVVTAHRAALRSAHRRLLIIVPDDPAEGDPMTEALRAEGWRVAQWSRAENPDESCQIMVADTRGDMGLWYRLAPVTFMASSLDASYGGQDPFEPAGLGSAILHGPHVSRYMSTYSRLSSAGAARLVRDADTMASSLTLLTAPDQAAAMAHAAWEVTTAGAEVTDRVMELVQDTLDLRARA
ncbi:MAG: 3-deoxy-D-manno-octulosonic acid transferase [Rhodobacterales bacterium]|nr:3-deoxy-D-manno-octulosonic acid transferase [Rhodobacterales bacterium]MDX5413674.1 3-deoxy-D-manno-octulosonic acid transferase [Rhodobacterales bacterium]